MKKIFGRIIDSSGRCSHYDSENDIVANKCFLCKKYYACYQCHDQHEDHLFEAWPVSSNSKEKIILCGLCQYEMNFNEYKELNHCSNCQHLFNTGCSKHHGIYFKMKRLR